MTFKNFVTASRPQTLTAILGPILVGYFLASKLSPDTLETIYLLPILISGLCIQIATNLFNDYLDALKGGDKEDRLGPLRITSAKLVDPKSVRNWALGLCGVAILSGIPIVMKTGWLFVVLGLFCVLLSYVYTGSKLSLAYTGTADLFVIIFFGGFAVWGTVYTLTLNPDVFSFLLGLQLGCLCDVILVVNNLRDQNQDVKNNKNTMVVRFGRAFGVMYYLGLILVGFGATLFWPEAYFEYKFLLLSLPWLGFSFYFWNWIRKNKPSVHYNKVLKFSSLTYFGFCLSLCIGFLI